MPLRPNACAVIVADDLSGLRVELEPSEIEVLVKRGYLDPKDKEYVAEIEAAANALLVDKLATP